MMPESRGRRESQTLKPRYRPKPDNNPQDFGRDILDDEAPNSDGAARDGAPAEPEHIGFDEETNNRYEEIKKGTTFISELQAMTMPQLLKTAKDEDLSEYTGLKKQDLIFKILKERVKQNGLMFGGGPPEGAPGGLGFPPRPE